MGKIDGIILLVFGCIIAFLTINCVVGVHFGVQYYFLLLAAELIIGGVLIIKVAEKTEDKLGTEKANSKGSVSMMASGYTATYYIS